MERPPITNVLTGPYEDHVRNIALIAAVVGSADSIFHVDHDPDDLIDYAARIYNRTCERFMEEKKA